MGLDRNKRKPRAARPNIKLNPQTKEKPVTDFGWTNSLLSEEAVEGQQMILLTERDWDLFLNSLEGEAPPNRALRDAVKRFKRSHY
jgi:uncharacterized protein (DUF1778 family)